MMTGQDIYGPNSVLPKGENHVKTNSTQLVLRLHYSLCSRLRGGRPFYSLNLRILWITFVLYLFNQFIMKTVTDAQLVHGHINDFLAMGILLPWTNLWLALYPQKDIRIMGVIPVLVFAVSAGLFWEFITPMYLASSVGDPLDLAAYLIGGALYATIVVLFKRVQVRKYESVLI